MAEPFGTITTNHEIIYSRYDPQAFVGHRWLVDKVAHFRDDPDRRHLFIVGEPGSGKSTFMAYLAATWNCPLHFIRVDNIGGVTGVDPRSFLISIGSQLYQKYGRDIFPKGASGTTTVTAGFTKDKAEVVGRFIDELYTLPFLSPTQRDVTVKAGIATGESKVIGERIRKMVDITHVLDEKTLLHVAIINPVQSVRELFPEEKVVILIDALDESLQYPGTQILDIIPRVADADFPDNLRLVMTTRPGDHLVPFREDDKLCLDDEVHKAKSLQDTRNYIDKHLAEEPLANAVAAWPTEEKEAYIGEVQTKSDGNFLYLYYFFGELVAAVKRGETDLEQIGVPKELDEIYQVFAVEKIRDNVSDSIYFTVVGEISADLKSQWEGMPGVKQVKVVDQQVTITMKDVNLALGPLYSLAPTVGVQIINPQIQQGAAGGAWEEKYLPILGILAVAYDALNREQLAGYAKVEVKYVDTIVGQLKQFLDTVSDENENRYRIYHNSFAEYLLDGSRNRDYPLDGPEYHYRVASYYKGEQNKWSQVDWGVVKENYPFQYLAAHLAAAKKNDDLYKLIDRPWREAQFSHMLSHYAFIHGVVLANKCACNKEQLNFLQMARSCLIYGSLVSLFRNIPLDIIEALARLGQVSVARGYAAQIQDEAFKKAAYQRIEAALKGRKITIQTQADLPPVKQVSEKTLEELKVTVDPRTKVNLLCSLAQGFALAGEKFYTLEYTELALKIICEQWDTPIAFEPERAGEGYLEAHREFRDNLLAKIVAFCRIANVLNSIRENQKAIDVAKQALAFVEKIDLEENYIVGRDALSKVGQTLANLNIFDLAFRTVEKLMLLDENIEQYKVLVAIIRSLRYHGMERQTALRIANDVLDAANSINSKLNRGNLLGSVALTLIDLGEHQQALNIVNRVLVENADIDDPNDTKIIAMHEVARALAQIGEFTKAKQISELTLAILQPISQSVGRHHALRSQVKAFVQTEDIDKAFSLAQEFQQAASVSREKYSRNRGGLLYGELAVDLAQVGKYEPALEAVKAIKGSSDFYKEKIIEAMAKNGDVDQALEMVQSLEMMHRLRSPAQFEMLGRMVQILIRSGNMTKAKDVTERMLVDTSTKFRSEWQTDMGQICLVLYLVGKEQEALSRATELIESELDNYQVKGSVLSNIAEMMARRGEFDLALAYLEQIPADLGFKDKALERIVLALVEVGEFDQAMVAVAKMGQDHYRKGPLLCEAVEILTGLDRVEDAQKFVKMIENKKDGADAQAILTAYLAKKGEMKPVYPILMATFTLGDNNITGLEDFFVALRQQAIPLAFIDQGKTLWQIFQASIDVDGWWKKPVQI